MNKPKKIVLDTNVVINIAKLGEKKLQDKSNPFARLFQMKQRGEVEFIITPQVLIEVVRGHHIDNGRTERFINKHCTLKQFTQEELNTCLDLALEFGYAGAIPNAKTVTSGNFDDALILAQATVLGLTLVTDNTRHFKNFMTMQQVRQDQGYNKYLKVETTKGFLKWWDFKTNKTKHTQNKNYKSIPHVIFGN